MSDPVKIDASQVDALRKKLERWVKIAPNEVKKVLGLGAEMVREEAQRHHLSGPRMPRGVGDMMNATLAKVSHRLHDSINYRVTALENGKFSAVVGTNVRSADGRAYGRDHELGLNGMPARPFLRPSLEKKRPAVFKMIEEAFIKSYGK
jgi:HK97 gp10 family phage protein